MLKNLKWEVGTVLSVKVDEGIFSLAQMRENYLMEFFDVFRTDEKWNEKNLNSVDVLFCVYVSIKNTKAIFSKLTDSNSVLVNCRPVQKRMLSAVFGSPGNTGADLIELSASYSNIDAVIVKQRLHLDEDLHILYKYELCGMVGSPEKIQKRLKLYYDTGVNWDESKKFLFPEIQPPAPSR